MVKGMIALLSKWAVAASPSDRKRRHHGNKGYPKGVFPLADFADLPKCSSKGMISCHKENGKGKADSSGRIESGQD
jgi:hypothetical protein